jgi:hypothetical protein
MIKDTIIWLETRVRDLGFDPQRLELRQWQQLHRELRDCDGFETSQRIRRALTEAAQRQRWP